MPEITPIYAALSALLFVTLSARVITYRRQNRLSLGDEGDKGLLKRMRAQGNCAEYVPIALILLLLVELRGAPGIAVHALGVTMLVGRVLHGWGFSSRPPVMSMRVAGMILTLLMIIVAAVGLLAHSLL